MTLKAKIWLVSILLALTLQAKGKDVVFSRPLLLNRDGPQTQAVLKEIERRITTVLGYVSHASVSELRVLGPFGWWPGPGGIDLWAYRKMGIDYVITGWMKKGKCAISVIDTTKARSLFKWQGRPSNIYDFMRKLVVRVGLAPPPFGTWILFSYRVPGSLNKDIMAIEFPSGKASRIDAPKGLNIFPAWYRDRVSYITYSHGAPMISIGSKLLNLPGNPMGFAASLDNKMLAVALNRNNNTDIYIMNTNTMHLRRITRYPAIDTSPAWSANAKRMVFVSDRTGFPQLWLIDDLKDPSPRCLNIPGNYNTSPEWANDNDLITFQTRIGLSFRVCTYRISTKDLHCLPLTGRSNEDPTFSPDGRLIAFVRQGRRNHRTLMIWDIQSGTVTSLYNLDGQCFTPSWEPATQN